MTLDIIHNSEIIDPVHVQCSSSREYILLQPGAPAVPCCRRAPASEATGRCCSSGQYILLQPGAPAVPCCRRASAVSPASEAAGGTCRLRSMPGLWARSFGSQPSGRRPAAIIGRRCSPPIDATALRPDSGRPGLGSGRSAAVIAVASFDSPGMTVGPLISGRTKRS